MITSFPFLDQILLAFFLRNSKKREEKITKSPKNQGIFFCFKFFNDIMFIYIYTRKHSSTNGIHYLMIDFSFLFFSRDNIYIMYKYKHLMENISIYKIGYYL